jgi:serine/threonine-protein kinase
MIGRKLAHYEITAKIGEGGMGEVYRARDVKLDRDVALKMISPEFRSDPERLARFEREAKTLAALQHPNIASIYGFEEVDDHPFLVMELVEGEDLAERLGRGPLEVGEAREIARQIARGLEEAHDRGIVHRDLKPANVKLTPEGKVKVLDFGLARALIDDPSAENMRHSPTITARMTQAGVILGTAAYMSPEQARGLVVDRRADIWAFGCLLYEMLTGRAPFAGNTITDMLADIVKTEPTWSDLPADTPASLRTLLWRCLRKDPRDRLRDIGDARLELSDTDLHTTGVIPAVDLPEPSAALAAKTPRSWMLPTLIAALLGLVIGFFVARAVSDTAQDADPVVSRLAIRSIGYRPFNVGTWPALTITRDGRAIVYSLSTSGSLSGEGAQIGVRSLDSERLVLVPGTNDGIGPFLSPDDQWIGYYDFVTEKLERVAMSGGQPSEITEVSGFAGGFWTADGIVYYTTSSGGGLYRVPAIGGEPELMLPLDEPDEVMFSKPTVIEEEGIALFTVHHFDQQRPSMLVSLDLESGERRNLFPADSLVGRLPSGAWLYLDDDQLMARHFDPRGGDEPIEAGVALEGDMGAQTAVSRNGTLAFINRKSGDARFGHVVFIDEEGRARNAVEGPLENARYPRISPDGTKLAITVGPGLEGTLWVHDLVGSNPPVNLTFDGHNIFPVWSPDGTQVAFKRSPARDASTDGVLSIVQADGSTLTPMTLDAENIRGDVLPGAWSITNKLVLSRPGLDSSGFDIWEVPVESPTEGRAVVETRFDEGATSTLSPDGRWLAYSSNRSGTREIWVQAYPDGSPTPVTSGGGQQPVWARDGKKLYYQTTGAIMAVDVEFRGSRITASKPRVAHQGAFLFSAAWTPRTYDVHPDGRLLIIQPVEYDDGRDDIIVVQNWFEEIRALVP